VIVLDTNVISEPLQPRADPAVVRWLDAQHPDTLYLTAVNLAEVLIGIALLSSGKRKSGMELGAQSILAKLFADRFLSFSREAAIAFAELGSRAAARGCSISVADCQIAAVHGFAVATRDTAPFLAADVPVINPWKS
jgi:predicted nucleic acid-binding protein